MRYAISMYKVQIKGQRKRYAWNVETLETGPYGFSTFIECGDSFYIFNARRAAMRAVKRHSEGATRVTEIKYWEIDAGISGV